MGSLMCFTSRRSWVNDTRTEEGAIDNLNFDDFVGSIRNVTYQIGSQCEPRYSKKSKEVDFGGPSATFHVAAYFLVGKSGLLEV